ncbi:MAG: carboxypeptidase regulatory-like domain-containing protein, partial [Micromonosporaceae bacterium]
MSRTVLRRLALAAVTLVTALVGVTTIPAFADPGTGAIAGHLLDGTTPLVSSQVTVFTPDFSWVASGFTDDTGAFRIADLDPGQYKVAFLLPGFVTQYSSQKDSFEAADLYTVADGVDTVIEEQVAPHGSIGGRITTAAGAGSPFANVLLYRDFDISAQGTADADGNYLLPYVTAGSYRLQINPQNAPQQWAHQHTQFDDADLFAVTVGSLTTVDETLIATGTIRGRFTSGGQGVGGVFISVEPVDSGGGSVSGSTDVDGNFELSTLPGSYRVRFQQPNGLSQYAHEKRSFDEADIYPVTGGGEIVINEEALTPGTIRGTLTDSAGNPVAGAGVTATSPDMDAFAFTNADGTYEIQVLEGTYKIRFDNQQQNQWAHNKTSRASADSFPVGAGEVVTVDEQLLAPGTVQVTAHDATTGAAITNFCASLRSDSFQFVCTQDGTVTFTAGPGTYEVSTYPDDTKYLFARVSGVVVTSGQTTTVDLRNKLAVIITALVTDRQTGAPVENVCVWAVNPAKHERPGNSALGCSDGTGAAKIEQLDAGTYNLFVTVFDGEHGHQWVGLNGGTGKQPLARSFSVHNGDNVSAPVKLDRGGTVSGVVTDKVTGAPIPFALVSLVSSNPGAGDGIGVGADSHGHYTFNNLGPYDWPLL